MPRAFSQALMTNGSLTAMQAIVSTPLALRAAACSTKPGRWRSEQVGVNAPGTANRTTFLPLVSAATDTSLMPSAVRRLRFTAGSLSPT